MPTEGTHHTRVVPSYQTVFLRKRRLQAQELRIGGDERVVELARLDGGIEAERALQVVTTREVGLDCRAPLSRMLSALS